MITDKRAIQAILNDLYEQGWYWIKKDNDGILISSNSTDLSEPTDSFPYIHDLDISQGWHKIKPKELPVSTYMHNRDGVEIFVGDVIKDDEGYMDRVIYNQGEFYGELNQENLELMLGTSNRK